MHLCVKYQNLMFLLICWFFVLQNEARKLNHQEVVEEDRRKKLPANFEQKRKFVDWEEQEEKKRKVNVIGLDKQNFLV